MIYAQYFILLITAIAFFRNLYIDINGRPAKEAKGFEGVVSTVIATAISIAIYYFAGAFTQIF
jgi:hypothetical protein